MFLLLEFRLRGSYAINEGIVDVKKLTYRTPHYECIA